MKISAGTITLLQEHRVSPDCMDAAHAMQLTIADPRCSRADAKKLAPLVHDVPEAFKNLLKVRRVPRVEIQCGQFSRLLPLAHNYPEIAS